MWPIWMKSRRRMQRLTTAKNLVRTGRRYTLAVRQRGADLTIERETANDWQLSVRNQTRCATSRQRAHIDRSTRLECCVSHNIAYPLVDKHIYVEKRRDTENPVGLQHLFHQTDQHYNNDSFMDKQNKQHFFVTVLSWLSMGLYTFLNLIMY